MRARTTARYGSCSVAGCPSAARPDTGRCDMHRPTRSLAQLDELLRQAVNTSAGAALGAGLALVVALVALAVAVLS